MSLLDIVDFCVQYPIMSNNDILNWKRNINTSDWFVEDKLSFHVNPVVKENKCKNYGRGAKAAACEQ